MALNDLEPSQKGVFNNFFASFRFSAHFNTELRRADEMAGDRPKQPAYEIFSTKRRFQQSKSRPFIGLRRPTQAGIKDGYPPKKWLFYRNYLV